MNPDYIFNFWLGTITIILAGTFLHFLFDITHKNKQVGLFAAVNESTWEHIKIALTPTFLWSLYDGFIYSSEPNYLIAKFASLFAIIFLIPFLFYFYQIFTKRSIFPLDILIFCLSIAASQFIFYYLLSCPAFESFAGYLSCIGIFVIFGVYCVFTIRPPKNILFKDPINGRYGFRASQSATQKSKSSKSKSSKNSPKK